MVSQGSRMVVGEETKGPVRCEKYNLGEVHELGVLNYTSLILVFLSPQPLSVRVQSRVRDQSHGHTFSFCTIEF